MSDDGGGAGDWDVYLAPLDLPQGTGWVAMDLNDFGLGTLDTDGPEHAARWSP